MKTLYICRHAKSSWKYHDLSDFERPLNNRGERDAPHMGKVLAEKGLNIDKMISSPAKRAFTTAKIYSKSLNYKVKNIIQDERIYLASASELMKIIQEVSDSISSLMIFGHNPGFTSLNNYLSDVNIDNIPTSAIACINLDIESWNDIEPNCGKMEFFEFPKLYF